MRDIPIFGAGVDSYSKAVTSQRRLNCFYSIRADQDKNQIILRGTPGGTITYTLPSAPIRGWFVVAGLLYVVAGAKLYSLAVNGTITSLGTLATAVGLVMMRDNGLQLLIVDGSAGYAYTIVAGSYAQAALNAAGSFGAITDSNFPNGAQTVGFLDGRMICEVKPASRQFRCSQGYDVTGWTNSLSLATFGTKDNYSDQLLSVYVINGVIFLLGAGSIEFWQDIGTAPLPFARIQGATRKWGLAAMGSAVEMSDTLFYLGQGDKGGMAVIKLVGTTPTPISTSDIDNLIQNFSFWQDAVGLGYQTDGHSMYQLTFPTVGRSFLYDNTTGFWYETQTGLGLLARHFANLGIGFNTFSYVSDATTGSIYQLSSAVYTDNGSPIKRQVVSRHLHADGNLLYINELLIDMETGVGLQSGQGSDPQLMLEVSRDSGKTFGIPKVKPLGKVGQYLTRVHFNRLGAAEDFVFRLTVTDPVKFTMIHAAVTTNQKEGASGNV